MPNALRAILWLFLMLSAMRGMAQSTCDFKLSGTVIDADNGKGLAYANVFLEELGRGVATDSLGNFVISDLCEGVYNAKISHIGCNPLKLKISVPDDDPLMVEMTHDDHVLDAFEVVDERHHSEHLSHMVAKSAEIQSRSGLQMAEQAALIPGVSTLNTGNNISKPVFRGLHSNRLIVLNNGIRQEGQYWGSEHSPEIDAYIASEYEVVEGADALRYASDGIAGILLVHPPDVFTHDSLRGSLQSSLSTNGRGGSVSGELSGKVLKNLPLYFRVQGTAKKLGWIKTSDAYLRNTGVEELNGSYALGWKGNKWRAEVFYSNFNQRIGLYRYSHLGNLSDLAEVLNGRPQPDTLDFSYDIERPFQEISHELFKAKLEVDLPGNEQVGFVYARQYNGRSEYDIHAGFNTPVSVPQLDYGLTTHLGEATWKHRIGGLEGTFGASGILRRNNFRG
ncbi:MAG TPA: TonB-dependent receptor, partial [Cryomorphaceae bacterium]|nr:TonB-dependent receptor [Cryomorphaceae bacterium]